MNRGMILGQDKICPSEGYTTNLKYSPFTSSDNDCSAVKRVTANLVTSLKTFILRWVVDKFTWTWAFFIKNLGQNKHMETGKHIWYNRSKFLVIALPLLCQGYINYIMILNCEKLIFKLPHCRTVCVACNNLKPICTDFPFDEWIK